MGPSLRPWVKTVYDTRGNMGYDHAEKKEVSVPSSSSGTGSGDHDEILFEEQTNALDRRETAATANTIRDDEDVTPPSDMLDLKRTHTAHHLGKLTLRAVDDDDPA